MRDVSMTVELHTLPIFARRSADEIGIEVLSVCAVSDLLPTYLLCGAFMSPIARYDFGKDLLVLIKSHLNSLSHRLVCFFPVIDLCPCYVRLEYLSHSACDAACVVTWFARIVTACYMQRLRALRWIPVITLLVAYMVLHEAVVFPRVCISVAV